MSSSLPRKFSWILFLGSMLLASLPVIFSANAQAPAKELKRKKPPALNNPEAYGEKSADEILKSHLQMLQEKGFVGKGPQVERRAKKLLKKGGEAFEARNFEEAALLYYSLVENPEFRTFIDPAETELKLIRSLYAARLNTMALDYVLHILSQGPSVKSFPEAMHFLTLILDRLEEWPEIDSIVSFLKKKFTSLPPEVLNEIYYTRGRGLYFAGKLPAATAEFTKISSRTSDPFHTSLKGLYHLGVVETLNAMAPKNPLVTREAGLKKALAIFTQVVEGTQFNAEDAIDPVLQQLHDAAILQSSRLQNALGLPTQYALLKTSDLRAQASFEKMWGAFKIKDLARAEGEAQGFLMAFPENGLIPDVRLLLAHIFLEKGQWDLALEQFRDFRRRYEGIGENILALANQGTALVVNDRFVQEISAIDPNQKNPEVISRLLNDPKFYRARDIVIDIRREEQNIDNSLAAWTQIRDAIIGGDKKVFFPSASRIRSSTSGKMRNPYQSKVGEKLFEAETLQKDLQRRMETLDEALKAADLKKGSTATLGQRLQDERQRLAGLEEKAGRLRSRLLEEEKNLPPEKKIPKDPYSGVITSFHDLINQEIALLPGFKQALTDKEARFKVASENLAVKRFAEMAIEFSDLIKGSYLGEIEVAFLRYQKKSGEEERLQIIAQINQFLEKYPKANEVPEQFFRLAELTYSQNKEKYFRAQERFERDYEAFTKGTLKEAPIEPKPDYSESIRLCENIQKDFPQYKQMDQVLYLLGYYNMESQHNRAAVASFQKLIDGYPDSPFVAEAHMRVAENYFDQGQLAEALAAYERIVKDSDSLFYEIALYKLAWTHYRLAHYDDAIKYFVRLIGFSDQKLASDEALARGGETKEELLESRKRLTDLRDEALTYVALSYSETGGAKSVISSFEKLGLAPYTARIVRKLSDLYFEQQRYDKAIEAAVVMLALKPLDPENPMFAERIIESYEKIGEIDRAFRERALLADRFGPKSKWFAVNKDNAKAVAKAKELVDGALIFVATYYHEKAQKDQSKENYEKAANAYQKYIWEFPDSPKNYEMRFYYAETLYALQNYDAAAYHYQKVVAADSKGKFLTDAAFNSVLAYEKVLALTGQDFQKKAYEKVKLEVPMEKAKVLTLKQIPLTVAEKNLLNAYDQYIRLFPSAEKVPDMDFKSALLIFQTGDFPAAKQRFRHFIANYPKHPLTASAYNYLINGEMAAQNWPEVERMTRALLKDSRYRSQYDNDKLKRLAAASLLFQAEKTQKSGQLEKAAEQYLAVENEFGGSDLVASGLFNAAANLESAGQRLKARATYLQVVERYPKTELAEKSLFKVAKSFEATADYREAAVQYERFAQAFPQSAQAADAQYNAGLMYAAAGSFSLAAKNYFEYGRRFPDRPDREETHFQGVRALEAAGQKTEAAQRYLEHASQFRTTADRQIECLVRAANTFEESGDHAKALGIYRQAATTFASNPTTGPGRRFAAQAQFALAEETFGGFRLVRLQLPEKRMTTLLEEKARRLEETQKAFTKVIEMGDPDMAVAALYRVGQSYQLFSETLFSAPVPKGLDAQGVEQYKMQLDDQALPLQDKAIAAYQKALAKSYELQVYNAWTDQILQQLQRFKPNDYPVMEEMIRTRPLKTGFYE